MNGKEKTGELMVITADGKGVVMRLEDLRPQTKKRAIESQKKQKKRLSKGEKRNSKRMATVGAVYTINRFRRTAEQIVNREEKKSKSLKAPKPEGKRVWASVEKEPKTVITEIFEEAFSRDPGREKNWVALVDGNKTQLQLIKNLAQKYQQNVTIVLDLIHVIEGACRHLIKDRMELTGARWSLKGAEAVLRLRSLCVSGDWTQYWQFHIKQEHQRNHRRWYQSGIPLLKSISQAHCSLNFTPKQMTI